MNAQLVTLMIGSLPAIIVLIAPLWVMVYFDHRAMEKQKSRAPGQPRALKPLRVLSSPSYQKAENA